MKRILTLLIFILVTACGTQPLAHPENDTLAESIELTSTPTVEPSIAPSSTATATPHVRFSYRTPAPTYTPTPTPTSMEIVQPEQSVNGYTFSEARPIPNAIGYSLTFFDWLPNDSNHLFIMKGLTLEVIDVTTGQAQPYSDGTSRVRNPVWLPNRQSAAYLTVDKQDPTIQYLWINDGENLEHVFTTSWMSPLAVTPDGNGVILFDANWQLTQVGNLDPERIKLATNTQAYIPSTYRFHELYQVAQTPDRSKALYFNNEWALLADFMTGNITPIDLEALRTQDMPPIDYIQMAVWNGTSDKVAFIAAVDGIRQGNNLFVFDIQSSTLELIVDEFHLINNLAWIFDNTHIIFVAETDIEETLDENLYPKRISKWDLVIVDTTSKNIKIIDVLPPNASIGSPRNLMTSLNSQFIAIVFGYEPRNPGAHIIEIKGNSQ